MIVTDEMRRNGEIHQKEIEAALEAIWATARDHDGQAFAKAALHVAARLFGGKARREGGECLLEDKCLTDFTEQFRALSAGRVRRRDPDRRDARRAGAGRRPQRWPGLVGRCGSDRPSPTALAGVPGRGRGPAADRAARHPEGRALSGAE